jgi:hypothetical protein
VNETRLALEDGSLVDLLDRLIDTGVVADGSVLITLAGVDLIRLDLKLLLSGVETLRAPPDAPGRPRHRQHGPRAPDDATRVAGPFPSYGPHGARQPAPVQRVDRPELWHWASADTVARALTQAPDLPGVPDRPQRPVLTPARLPAAALRDVPDRPGGPPADPGPGIAGLVIAVVDILRQLLERQALRRMEAGGLTGEEIERLGRTLDALERQVRELSEAVGVRRRRTVQPGRHGQPPG